MSLRTFKTFMHYLLILCRWIFFLSTQLVKEPVDLGIHSTPLHTVLLTRNSQPEDFSIGESHYYLGLESHHECVPTIVLPNALSFLIHLNHCL